MLRRAHSKAEKRGAIGQQAGVAYSQSCLQWKRIDLDTQSLHSGRFAGDDSGTFDRPKSNNLVRTSIATNKTKTASKAVKAVTARANPRQILPMKQTVYCYQLEKTRREQLPQ